MTEEIIKIDANTEIEVTRYGGGNLKSKIPYVNGVKHGAETWWNEDGKKWLEEMWRDGKEHGTETGWNESGMKRWEVTWIHGKQHGVGSQRYESGQKEWEKYCIAGEEYARIEWDEEGNVIKVDLPTLTPTINPLSKLKNHINMQLRYHVFKPTTK